MLEIKRYNKIDDAVNLYKLIKNEGNEWIDYWGSEKYKRALDNSIVYVAYDGDVLCGYVRCKDDDGFGIYIYDLLVDKSHRGNKYGFMLMQKICDTFPDNTVYVMSDVDLYYEKQGFKREGSIFIVNE